MASDTLDAFDFSATALIRPPKEAVYEPGGTGNVRKTRLYIDSRDRDPRLEPDPATYSVALEEPVYDVVGFELLDARIPFGAARLVGPRNDRFVLVAGGSRTDVVVPHGDYAGAPEIAAAITAALPPTVWASHDPVPDVFVFASASPFSLEFGEAASGPTIGRLLGFTPGTHSSTADGVLRAPYRRPSFASLKTEPVFMHVESMTSISSASTHVNKCFAVLTPDNTSLCSHPENAFRKTFWPPLARVAKLRVRFRDFHGNPCDFQNQDNSFQVMLTSLRNNRSYQSFIMQ